MNSLWSRTATPSLNAPALSGDLRADLVIIGGGFTGISAALHAAEAGMSVVLLEADAIGAGASGKNVGFVNAGLWAAPDVVAKEIGEGANRALGAGPQLVWSLIEKFKIECDALRSGNLYCAHASSGMRNLRARHKQEDARGAPVFLLDAKEVAEATGTNAYVGGWIDHRTGTIQPLSYARGLARAAVNAGAKIFEHSCARHIEREGDMWRVETVSGAVHAKTLLLCTNSYHRDLPVANAPKIIPLYWFQLATKPLPEDIRQTILPGLHGCLDTGYVPTSFRMDGAGRLLMGSVGRLGGLFDAHEDWARRRIAELFPQAADVGIEFEWHGKIGMTGNNMPRIVRLGENAVGIFGYNGRGIAPGTTFGKCAAHYAQSGDESAFPLPLIDRTPREGLGPALERYWETGAVMWHLMMSR